MAKLTIISDRKILKAKAKTLPIGTLVRLPWRQDEIAIVTFIGLVSLSSDSTWSDFAQSEVEVLPSGFKIELEQQ